MFTGRKMHKGNKKSVKNSLFFREGQLFVIIFQVVSGSCCIGIRRAAQVLKTGGGGWVVGIKLEQTGEIPISIFPEYCKGYFVYHKNCNFYQVHTKVSCHVLRYIHVTLVHVTMGQIFGKTSHWSCDILAIELDSKLTYPSNRPIWAYSCVSCGNPCRVICLWESKGGSTGASKQNYFYTVILVTHWYWYEHNTMYMYPPI